MIQITLERKHTILTELFKFMSLKESSEIRT